MLRISQRSVKVDNTVKYFVGQDPAVHFLPDELLLIGVVRSAAKRWEGSSKMRNPFSRTWAANSLIPSII